MGQVGFYIISELNNMNDKEALNNLREKHSKLTDEISKVTGEVSLPPGFKLPF